MGKRTPQKVVTTYGAWGLVVTLDPNEINVGDPGAGTPVKVTLEREHEGSFDAAICEREVNGRPLSVCQVAWLEDMRPAVDKWLEIAWTVAEIGADTDSDGF